MSLLSRMVTQYRGFNIEIEPTLVRKGEVWKRAWKSSWLKKDANLKYVKRFGFLQKSCPSIREAIASAKEEIDQDFARGEKQREIEQSQKIT